MHVFEQLGSVHGHLQGGVLWALQRAVFGHSPDSIVSGELRRQLLGKLHGSGESLLRPAVPIKPVRLVRGQRDRGMSGGLFAAEWSNFL